MRESGFLPDRVGGRCVALGKYRCAQHEMTVSLADKAGQGSSRKTTEQTRIKKVEVARRIEESRHSKRERGREWMNQRESVEARGEKGKRGQRGSA